MNIKTRPISEISRRATHILFKEMGVVDTIRFLNQISVGRGDYTKERENWLGKITLDDAISQIKSGKKSLAFHLIRPGRPGIILAIFLARTIGDETFRTDSEKHTPWNTVVGTDPQDHFSLKGDYCEKIDVWDIENLFVNWPFFNVFRKRIFEPRSV